MKQTVLGLAYMLLVCGGALAQGNDSTQIAAVLDRLNKAMVDKDEATLSAIYHPALWYGHSDGRLDDKPGVINDVMNGPVDFITLDAQDRRIKVAGNTATARFIFHATALNKDKDTVIRLGVTTVWKKEKSGWQLYARQSYKL